MTKKLWYRIFTRVAVILIITATIISVAESSLLLRFYIANERQVLLRTAESVKTVYFDEDSNLNDAVSDLSERLGVDIEVYDSSGKILCTTFGSQMLDFFNHGNGLSMSHYYFETEESRVYPDGSVISRGTIMRTGEEYLICTKELESGVFADIRIQIKLLETTAAISGKLVIMITLIGLIPALLWMYFFIRHISKPVSELTKITGEFAQSNFSHRADISGDDEIGMLGTAVNNMADSLSGAINELKETNTRLTEALDEERKLDEMRKGLIANVSHELKTPISVINGYAEGLKLGINDENRIEYCDIIIDESRRMNELVLGILELSRYESGKLPINREMFDICGTVSTLGKRIFEKSEVVFENRIPENTLVFADIKLTQEQLKAYFENALSHTANGGKVVAFCTRENGFIRICVFNEGENIDEKIMPDIWQSFYRGDVSHKRDGTRYGLGLSIVSAIAKQSSGECGVYNTENGVCFFIGIKEN